MAASLILFVTAILAAPADGDRLTWQTYDAIRAHVLPDAAEERWRAIPWRSTFHEAVADARAEGKPILLWAMNGHPLGCV